MGLTKPSSTYEHPRKSKGREVNPTSEVMAPVSTKKNNTSSAGEAEKKKKVRRGNAATSIDKKDVQIRLILYPPVSGQLPLYDEMIKSGLSANKVLLGLLKKGFLKFETDLLAGKFSTPTIKLETDGKPVDTTRNVSSEFLNLAKELFDPYDILSDRALGQRVAEAVVQTVGKARRNGEDSIH